MFFSSPQRFLLPSSITFSSSSSLRKTLKNSLLKQTNKLNSFLPSFIIYSIVHTQRHKVMAEEEVALDLEELRHLQSIAKRPRILSLISSQITNFEKEKEKLSKDAVSQPPTLPTPAPVAAVPSTPALHYVTLASFSWDQDDDKIKIYVSLEGVEQEKVETVFKRMSADIKFHDVQGKNYRCAIPKLNKEIVPEKSKVLVKPKRVTIILQKASKGNWIDLHYKEDKLKPSAGKEKDPMSGIMDLMKNMYEEGDEDMKRTIAKAWTDARTGKVADPLKRYP